MSTRVYLTRDDTFGARFGARHVSTAVDKWVALRTAETWRGVDDEGAVADGGGTSRVTLTVTLDAGATLPAGSVACHATLAAVRYVTLADVTNGGGSSADFDVEARAEHPGPVTASAGSITVPVTAVTGWTAVTNGAASTVGAWPSPRIPQLGGGPRGNPPPSVHAAGHRAIVRRWSRRGAVCGRLLPVGGNPPSITPSWTFEVRWFLEEPERVYRGGDPLWHEPPPTAVLPPGYGGHPVHEVRIPVTWRAPLSVVTAESCPIGAMVWIDPKDIDGEIQGAGRGWVPAVVTGYGDEIRLATEPVPSTNRAARIEVESLPPHAADLVRAGRAVDDGLTAVLLDNGGGSGFYAFRFTGDDARDVAFYNYTGDAGTIAGIAATSTLPRWTSTRAVTLVELDPTRAPGVFTAQ